MKRCPECRRDYFDDSLLYCLDDGSALLEGPATASSTDEPATALYHSTDAAEEGPTREQIPTTERTAVPRNGIPHIPKSWIRKGLLPGFLLALIGLVAFAGYRYYNADERGRIGSIAVLPFENRSGNADTDYLSDGLSDSLIYRLTQLPGLKVSPTNSVIRYRGRQTDLAQIAKELEVDAVMSGRLAQRGDDLTISVELTDTRTRKLVWAEQYERKMSDLLATQREIATTVTQKLQLKLSSTEVALTKQYTNSNDAFQLYLKGRFHWNKRTPEGIRMAIDHFKAASEKDPNFVLAYVGLADSYLVGRFHTRGNDKEALSLANANAKRAFEIDPSLVETNATLGLVNTGLWNWAEAEKNFKRALEIDSHYPPARHWFSMILRRQGRFEESFEQIKQAQRDDPLSLPISNNVAKGFLEKGDVFGAIEESRRILEIGEYWVIYQTLAHCYLKLGRDEEALANAKKTVDLLPNSSITLKVLGYVKARLGNRSEALAIAHEIEDKFAKGEADGRDVAIVYAGLGNNDEVFRWLEKDLRNRNSTLSEIRLDEELAPLRNDTRFKSLLKRMGLPE